MKTVARVALAGLMVIVILGTGAVGLWAAITISTGADPLQLLLSAREVAVVEPEPTPTPTAHAVAATATPTQTLEATPDTAAPTAGPCGAEVSIEDSSTSTDLIFGRLTPYLEDLGLCDAELKIEIVDGETVNQTVAARSGEGALIASPDSLSAPALGYTACFRLGRSFVGGQIFVAAGDPGWVSWRSQSGEPVYLGPGIHPSAVLLHELYHAHECEARESSSEEKADAYALGNLESLQASPVIVFTPGLVPASVPPASAASRAYWEAIAPVLDRYLAYIQEWNDWWAQRTAQIEGDIVQPGYWDWLCGQMWGWDRLNTIRDEILALSPPPEFAAFQATFLAAIEAEIEADQHKGSVCQGDPSPGYLVNVDAWNAWVDAVDRARTLAEELASLVPTVS